MTVTGGRVSVSQGSTPAGPGTSVEARLERLETWNVTLQKEIERAHRELRDEITNREAADLQESTARESGDAAQARRLELTATGGLDLTAVGIAWLLVGTMLVGFAPEIASVKAPVEMRSPWAFPPPRFILLAGYIFIAMTASAFYAFFAFDIHNAPRPSKAAAVWHQRWLNFCGSVVGWAAGWFVISQLINGDGFGWQYALLALVSFVGITGYLPYTVVKLVNSVGGLIERIPGLTKPDND